MFTGIILATGRVVELGDRHLVIDAPDVASEPPGSSIAVDGCCLTVVEARGPKVRFDLLPETLAATSLGRRRDGDLVNLEPALRVGARMGGHWVQGHVDAVGTVRSAHEQDGSLAVWLDVPTAVLRYCIDKGSICANGASLTVMELDATGVKLSLIPETRDRTNLGALGPGDPVNLEADVLAKYVERLVARP